MLTVGERIKNRRKELHMTQEELGDKLGITRSAVCKVEKDKEQNLTIDRVGFFAKALGCSPSYLMGWEEPLSDPELDAEIIMDEDFKKLYEKYRKLNIEQRKAVEIMIDTMLK